MTEKRDEIATDLEIAMRSFEIELDRHAEGGSRAYHVSAEREFLLDTLGELHARALAIGDEAVIARVETVWQWLEGLRVPAAQRSTRILGTFARLKLRDSKAGYLRHIPRVWRWLGQDLAHPALTPVRIWFDRHVPAEARGVPPALAA